MFKLRITGQVLVSTVTPYEPYTNLSLDIALQVRPSSWQFKILTPRIRQTPFVGEKCGHVFCCMRVYLSFTVSRHLTQFSAYHPRCYNCVVFCLPVSYFVSSCFEIYSASVRWRLVLIQHSSSY